MGIVNIHAVIDGALVGFHWKERDSNEPVVEKEVLLSGLQAVDRQECPFNLHDLHNHGVECACCKARRNANPAFQLELPRRIGHDCADPLPPDP